MDDCIWGMPFRHYARMILHGLWMVSSICGLKILTEHAAVRSMLRRYCRIWTGLGFIMTAQCNFNRKTFQDMKRRVTS